MLFAHAEHSHELKNFSSIKGLHDLTSAFFSQPEFTGNFTETGKNKPSPQQRGLNAETLQTGIENFYQKFTNNNASFFNKTAWIGNNIDPKNSGQYTYRYVQKMTVDTNATICAMGDFHGSVHSLMRNMLRLQALGYLDENLTIKKKNFYMVFLGDYVDRGRWSAEILITLIKLKLQNWDQVMLLAGNHETKEIAESYGLLEELILKYGHDAGTYLFNEIDLKFFRTLPVALFITCNGNAIQCCHGGIAKQYQPKKLLENSKKFFENVGTENQCLGLFWSDFCAGNHGEECPNRARGFTKKDGVLMADQKYTKRYLKDNNLKAIVRAHQDREFGLKLFYDAEQDPTQPGPFHWADVLTALGISDNKFQLNLLDYYPVFTFSSAVEGQDFPYDCFGLINTERAWNKWMLEVYEIFLGRNHQNIDRDGKYICIHNDETSGQTELINPSGIPGKDPINITWKTHDQPSVSNTAISIAGLSALSGLLLFNYINPKEEPNKKPEKSLRHACNTTMAQIKRPFIWIKESWQHGGPIGKKIAAAALAYSFVELASLIITKKLIATRCYNYLKGN